MNATHSNGMHGRNQTKTALCGGAHLFPVRNAGHDDIRSLVLHRVQHHQVRVGRLHNQYVRWHAQAHIEQASGVHSERPLQHLHQDEQGARGAPVEADKVAEVRLSGQLVGLEGWTIIMRKFLSNFGSPLHSTGSRCPSSSSWPAVR